MQYSSSAANDSIEQTRGPVAPGSSYFSLTENGLGPDYLPLRIS
jgi:hypothetical protein